MKEISCQRIIDSVARLFIEANCHIQEEVYNAWSAALDREVQDSQAKEAIEVMIKNAWIAWKKELPLCQDTGQAVVFIEQGEEIKVIGGSLFDAINRGIEKGGREGYLRKSVVKDPLYRDYEGGYGPAIIHHTTVPGEILNITLYPAGCGCEQMNCAAMFPPHNEIETIKEFVVKRVRDAGSRPCPPTIIGLGIGGNLEESAHLARLALLRPINEHNRKYEFLEKMLFEKINQLGIGPQGLGGKTTVLAVNIETSGCHRANLPVAIAFNCHIGRWKKWNVLREDTLPLIAKEEAFRKRLKAKAESITLFQQWPGITLPLTDDTISRLKAGDKLLLDGFVYTARDAAHRRIERFIKMEKELPFPLKGEVIYYVGPTPPRPGEVIGSAGPTTSARMDFYSPLMLSQGIKGMLGKGYRSREVMEAIKKYKALYFITFAGAGALLSQYIDRSEIVAFDDLGTEAVRKLKLNHFPVIVACDAEGRDIFENLY